MCFFEEETLRNQKRMRTCEVCLEVKPYTEYKEAPANTDGLHKWCETCRREYFRNWSKRKRINRPKTDCPYSKRGGYRPRRIQPIPEKNLLRLLFHPGRLITSSPLIRQHFLYHYYFIVRHLSYYHT
jgi:hypothetical protein